MNKLVYAAIALGAIHSVLVVKSWPLLPVIYAVLVAMLLGYRIVRMLRRRLAAQALSVR